MIKYWADRKQIDVFCYFPDCKDEECDILLYRGWLSGPPSLIWDNTVNKLRKAGLFKVNNIRINLNFLAKGFII